MFIVQALNNSDDTSMEVEIIHHDDSVIVVEINKKPFQIDVTDDVEVFN